MDRAILAVKDGELVDVTNEPLSTAHEYKDFIYTYKKNMNTLNIENLVEQLEPEDKKLYDHMKARGLFKELFELGFILGAEQHAKEVREQLIKDREQFVKNNEA